MRHDWMPSKREEQLAMANKWITELVRNMRFLHSPVPRMMPLD